MGEFERLKIEIDRVVCRGAGECALRAERTFAVDDDDRAKLISRDTDTDTETGPGPGPDADSNPDFDPDSSPGSNYDDEPVILAAARACPSFAISVSRGGVRLV